MLVFLVGKTQEVEIRVHKVQRGESLEFIASKYGVSVEELQSHNSFLDKYFYVGQTLNVPIKIKPKVEHSYSTSTIASYEERPVAKKKRPSRGWGYASPNVYTPFIPMAGGFGNPLLNPGYALMQAQQQMAPAQQELQERWKYEQQSQQFFQNQQYNAWQVPPGGGVWNSVPVMVETPYVGTISTTGTTENISTPNHSTSSGHSFCSHCANTKKCPHCGGDGRRTDNLFGTGKSATADCGVCGGSGRCPYCK